MPSKKRRNPFYMLLVPAGIAFVVTAFAYGFMAFQAVNATRENSTLHTSHALFQWMREYGNTAMLIELAALAVLTVGAIATENVWNPPEGNPRRANRVPPLPPAGEGRGEGGVESQMAEATPSSGLRTSVRRPPSPQSGEGS